MSTLWTYYWAAGGKMVRTRGLHLLYYFGVAAHEFQPGISPMNGRY